MSVSRQMAAAAAVPVGIPDRWGTAWRRPSSMAATALLCAAAFVRFGVTPEGLTMAFFLAVLMTLSVIDVERRILPNAIVLPSAALVLGAQLALYPDRAFEWFLAAGGAAAVLFVLVLVNPAGMGMGDVKLALLLGAGLGGHVISALIIASLSVLPVALCLLARHGPAARKTAIPFGPFLAFGAALVVLVGVGDGSKGLL
jgi:leader peptidase (prepilin peptidase) / N-methyltransferase